MQAVGEQSQVNSSGSVGVLDSPEMVRAQCVVLDEFLAPQELEELVSYTLQREAEFQSSEAGLAQRRAGNDRLRPSPFAGADGFGEA